jgi:lipopolysaccharide/colanic/teichoic acid biosynthesis glycosyltransferase
LHTAEVFRALLERERLRSDRSGAVFSLAAFTIGPPNDSGGEHTLARILRERLRALDDAGLLADGRIAALLPETPPRGAWALADDILLRYEQTGGRIRCEVFAYPACREFRFDLAAQPPGQNGHAAPSAGDSAGGGSTPLDRRRRLSDSRDHGPDVSNGAEAGDDREVASLEALLAEALPPWKRGLDLLGASAIVLLASPLMLAAAVAVKLSSSGPVLFAQRRDGLGGRPFTMYKFRTMAVDAEQRKAQLRAFSEQDGPAFKMTHDPRVTRVGRLLRASSIDELPQLWNVLRGEMSLVGPRPLPCDESAACEAWQRRRLTVTPGLTCIWQVAGRSLVSFAEWVRMDLQYVGRRTPLHDLKLLLLTVPALLLRRGK